MTNNTINNVPCELLETLIEQHITAHGFTNHTARQAQLILCAPSPAGVDGLSVVAVVSSDDGTTAGYGYLVQAAPDGEELCRLSDAQAIIDGLRGEIEVMTQHANNYSRMFEECAEERDQQARRIGELAELAAQASVNCKNTAYYLRKYRPDLADICSGWCVAIDAALSAGKDYVS